MSAILSNNQKSLIINLLDSKKKVLIEKRELYEAVIPKIFKRIDKILEKLYSDEVKLTKPDKSFIAGCVNEKFPNVSKDFREQIVDENPSNLIAKIEGNPELVELRDNYIQILISCDYFKEADYKTQKSYPYLSYNVLKKIEFFRNCDRILLSDPKREIYKVSFLTKKNQGFTFEIKSRICLRTIEPAMITESFHYPCDKKEAYKWLQKCDKKNYPDGYIDFLQQVLS